jgi:hypothetical protein
MEGDGWLRREMGGFGGRWVTCYGSSLGSNLDIIQKYKMGDKGKEVANTLYCRPSKIYKIYGKKVNDLHY